MPKMIPLERQEFDTAGLTTSYQKVGNLSSTVIQILKLINESNVAVDVSYDGITTHDRAPAGSAFVLDVTANQQVPYAVLTNTQIWIKGASPGVGTFYVAALTERFV